VYSDPRRQVSSALSPIDIRKASATPTPALKVEQPVDRRPSPSVNEKEKPGRDYPARHTSTLDPNANPIHPSTGKPILSTDFDADFPTESTKPWRKPGSDVTDFFNYGFDEFTWASYCLKQQQMPKEISEIKAQADFMKSFVEGIPGGGVPGMPGVPTGPAAQGLNGGMPGMAGMPNEAEMQQKFMGMVERGIDPSSMNPEQFMQQMMMDGGNGPAFGAQGPNFGPMQGGGQHQPAQMGYGGGAGPGGGYDQGGNYGRGRGRGRRGW
jgi:pre-mRNA 3'-end-processing factor FIP1